MTMRGNILFLCITWKIIYAQNIYQKHTDEASGALMIRNDANLTQWFNKSPLTFLLGTIFKSKEAKMFGKLIGNLINNIVCEL